MQNNLEIEIKLTIKESSLVLLDEHSIIKSYARTPPEVVHIMSVYYDTNEHFLLKNGFVLRTRFDGSIYRQTFKSADKSNRGLHKRMEWEQVIPSFKPDYSIIPDENLLKVCNDQNIFTKIIPIFKTNITRKTWYLQIDDTQIELALDQGRVLCDSAYETICEIELELVAGDEKKLHEIAALLQKDLPVHLENQSKAERGYRLHQKYLN
ncbi:MAG: inorganic triphosphatase [Gammaproteobacteria bacterium]